MEFSFKEKSVEVLFKTSETEKSTRGGGGYKVGHKTST